ncbi:MAG: pseudouridine synthase [Chloroflexota bacterium]
MEERVQKLMSQAGVASRRESEAMIERGRVMINGERAKLGDKADLAVDDVRVDGARLHIEENRVYLMVYKPMGIVTTVRAQEQEKRRTVRELVPIEGKLYPVGRLDADSEGLVLLTNDGELAQKLTHPRYEHPKVYEVTLYGNISDEALEIWRRGIVLDDGPTKAADVKVLSRDKETTQLRVTMSEGRKRQIRRIASTLGHPVRQLIRTELDTVKLGTMRIGEWRYLTDNEIKALQDSAASTPRRGKFTRPLNNPKTSPTTRSTVPVRSTGSSGSSGSSDQRGPRRPSSGKPVSRRSPGRPGATSRPGKPGTRRRPASSGTGSRRSGGAAPGSRRRAPTRRNDHSR